MELSKGRGGGEEPNAEEPDAELDPIAIAFFSLPVLGMPPKPALVGLTKRAAKAITVVAPQAWRFARDVLGTDYAPEASLIAERLAHEAPDVITFGHAITWARAIAWTIAQRSEFAEFTGGELAEELGTTIHTMRAKEVILRRALRL